MSALTPKRWWPSFVGSTARAADAAKGILAWAGRDRRLDIRFTGTGGVIEAERQSLLKLWPKRAIAKGLEVSLHTLADYGERWDKQRIEHFVQELSDVGVNLEPNERRWPKAPLEPLADEARRPALLRIDGEGNQGLDRIDAAKQSPQDANPYANLSESEPISDDLRWL